MLIGNLTRSIIAIIFTNIHIKCPILRVASNPLTISNIGVWSLLALWSTTSNVNNVVLPCFYRSPISWYIIAVSTSPSGWLRDSITFSIDFLSQMHWWNRDSFCYPLLMRIFKRLYSQLWRLIVWSSTLVNSSNKAVI